MMNMTPPTQPPALMAQADVNYRPAGSLAESCSNCTHFSPPSNCDVVEGPVEATGMCDAFEAR